MTNLKKTVKLASAAAVVLVTAAGCRDFLGAGSELQNDPNRPLIATNTQRFVGIQTNIGALLLSDLARISGLFTQQFRGGQSQYSSIYTYGITESTSGGFYAGLYGGGGLSDVRALEAGADSIGDKRFVGIAQVQEALLVGTTADFFGDIVYTQALKGDSVPNPKLDPQLAVYDSVQTLLSRAIVNLASATPTDIGPRGADLAYGGDPAKWTKLAHTLKARFYLHTAEVRPGAYALALAEAKLGIVSKADDFNAVFSGAANEQNYQYQFSVVQRAGYYVPNPFFVNLLKSRNDPRLQQYFDSAQKDINSARLKPNFTQGLVTANENLLIWSEAAYRTGDQADALTQLNRERALAGLPALSGLTGTALIREILTEKYIALFGTTEIYNDYKRTCFPNLVPAVAGQKITARLFYDTSERNTNTNIPDPTAQPTRNANDPANKTVADDSGAACLGQ